MVTQGPLAWEPREPSGLGADTPEALAMAHLFREFADQAVARLPLYRRLCEAAADDVEVAARLLLAPPDQQVPNLLLASVHDVLLAGEPSPLADWYPTVLGRNASAGPRARTVGSGDDDPWPHFRTLALHHPRVEHLLETASTQTNEVGRSAAIYPGVFSAARHARSAPDGGARPIGIVELGAAAGLNLDPSRYGYRYRLPADEDRAEEVITSVGMRSRLVIDCELRGRRLPPLPDGTLDVVSAIGIDRHPLLAARAEDARWLVACQWPEEIERTARLRAAIALAAEEPPIVDRGDAVAAVGRLVAAVPAHALPVVVATWMLCYLSIERQHELLGELDRIGTHRDVALVFAEQPERVPGLPVPPRPDGQPDGRSTALVRMEWRDGDRTEVRLADMHPHGRWIEWLEEPAGTAPADSDPDGGLG
ncbi:MAG: DUF2332 domain-containing protein [Acidimicrobiales bacterium]